jgi:flagellin
MKAPEKIGSIIKKLTQVRGELGVTQNLLVRTVQTLNVTIENLNAADSTIRETNIAEEVAILTQNQPRSLHQSLRQGKLNPQSDLSTSGFKPRNKKRAFEKF